MFVDLDWPLNASSLLSASAELLVSFHYVTVMHMQSVILLYVWPFLCSTAARARHKNILRGTCSRQSGSQTKCHSGFLPRDAVCLSLLPVATLVYRIETDKFIVKLHPWPAIASLSTVVFAACVNLFDFGLIKQACEAAGISHKKLSYCWQTARRICANAMAWLTS